MTEKEKMKELADKFHAVLDAPTEKIKPKTQEEIHEELAAHFKKYGYSTFDEYGEEVYHEWI